MTAPAYSILWTAANGQRYLIDVEGEAAEAWESAASMAIAIAESGRQRVVVVVEDMATIPPGELAEARARLIKAKVLLEAMALVKEAVG